MFFSFRKKKGPKNKIGITNQLFANKNLKEINGFELVTDVIKTQDSRISQVYIIGCFHISLPKKGVFIWVAHRNNSKPNNIGSVGIYKPMSLVYSSILTDNGANRASERNAFSV
jgi:hypothetical protein